MRFVWLAPSRSCLCLPPCRGVIARVFSANFCFWARCESPPRNSPIGMCQNGLEKLLLRFTVLALRNQLITSVSIFCFTIWIDLNGLQQPFACLNMLSLLEINVPQKESCNHNGVIQGRTTAGSFKRGNKNSLTVQEFTELLRDLVFPQPLQPIP